MLEPLPVSEQSKVSNLLIKRSAPQHWPLREEGKANLKGAAPLKKEKLYNSNYFRRAGGDTN